jgi:hypothetical protein
MMMKLCKRGHSRIPANLNSGGGCKTCCKQATVRWKHDNRGRHLEHRRIYAWKVQNINITIPQWKKLQTDQAGCCAICKRPEASLPTALAVDHNHQSGKIRGLLCSACNYHVGYFEKFGEKLMEYLNG